MTDTELAKDAIGHCRAIAALSDDDRVLTRLFLSAATRDCHAYLTRWMKRLGMGVRVDNAGNLRGFYAGREASAKRILMGSHLDTVPDAGAYDGVLGVVLALSLVEALGGKRLPFGIEVIGFSEEEGVRFGVPFIGSRALLGELDEGTLEIADRAGITMRQAIHGFGLQSNRLREAELDSSTVAFFEFHIEQGPVLEHNGVPLGVVEAISGQSRASITFQGRANHAGTTPMSLRQDALCAAAEWITCIEKDAKTREGLVATVGRIEAKPGAGNVIPGEVTASLDVRHATDVVRRAAFEKLIGLGEDIAYERGLEFRSQILLDQAAVPMDRELTCAVEEAIRRTGVRPHWMSSGAGHDAMILARKLPCGMIFLRSPGGISHHPDENVNEEDVTLAIGAGVHLLDRLSTCSFLT